MSTLDQSCACGHRRWRHNNGGTGPCLAVTQQVDMSGLPTPKYPAGTEDHPKAWPTNWPAVADLPVIDVVCGCPAFTDPDDEGGCDEPQH